MPRLPAFRVLPLCGVFAAALLGSAACNRLQQGIDPKFVDTFIAVNQRGDDRASSVAFDAANKVLAVGRESGRLELWDARKPDARVLLEAHSVRVEHIAFGGADGIVLTNSAFDRDTRIWDVRSGELLHEIEGGLGPTAPSPQTGVYVVAKASELTLYEHARRTLIGGPVEIDGVITAICGDATSGLVAVGTARGSLHLLKLEKSNGSLKLTPLREARPYEPGNWVQAVALQDGGKRLISAVRRGVVAEWDTATLERKRVLPTTLGHVNSASFTPDQPWLVLAGTIEPEGLRDGKIELVDLRNGVALRYKANTNYPRAVLLPEISAGLILQSGSVRRIRYLDQ